MSQTPLVTDFSAGELSPRMAGRVDLPLYRKGAAELENFVPFIQGGITTRPGLKYIGAVKSGNTGGVRLVPFNVSSTVGFILEMGVVTGVGYCRIWGETGGVMAVLQVEGVDVEFLSSGSPAPFPYTTMTAIREIQVAQDGATLYLAQKDADPRKLTWGGGTTFTMGSLTFTGNVSLMPPSTSKPRAVAIWGGRLWFGGGTTYPQRLWCSETYDATNGYTHFHYYDTISYTTKVVKAKETWADPKVPEYEDVTSTKDVTTDSNAMDFTLGSDQNEAILWLAAGKDLVVGCSTSEFIIPAGVTALAPQAVLQTRYGSSELQGMMLNQAILFSQAGKTRLREYYYQDTNAAYKSPELTFHAEHILKPGVREYDFSQGWQPMLYCVRTDGTMAVLVYQQDYGIQAWCRYTLSTALASSTFESVAVIVDGDGNDSVYVATKRNGSYALERLDTLLATLTDNAQDPTYQLDSYELVTKAATNTVARFGSGTAVKIVYAGVAYSATTGAGGEITMPAGIANGTTKVGVGLAYDCHGTTCRIQRQEQAGNGYTSTRRIVKTRFMLLSSYSFEAKSNEDYHAVTLTGPYTGDADIELTGDWATDVSVTFRQTDPLPLTILAIAPEIV